MTYINNTLLNLGPFDLAEIDIRKRWQLRPPAQFPAPWANGYGFDQYGLWQSFTVKGITQKMRYIPPGEFLMGSAQEEAHRHGNEVHHRREVKQGFWLAETTVTQALWQAVMSDNPSHFKDKKNSSQRPVESVSWRDCQAFCQKLNELIPELDITLPDEVQWEYACRAGNQSAYWWGEDISKLDANFNANNNGTVPVSEYQPNPQGLYQMHGNVFEWCQNIWIENVSMLDSLPVPGNHQKIVGSLDKQAVTDSRFALRGGGWQTRPHSCRAANRSHFEPGFYHYDTGLRVAQVIAQENK